MFGHLDPGSLGSEDRRPFRASRRRADRRAQRDRDVGAHLVSPPRSDRELTRPAALILLLVASQVTLGALTVLSQRDVWINSVHLVCGALVLATSLVITLQILAREVCLRRSG